MFSKDIFEANQKRVKAISSAFEKAKPLPIGTIRTHGGKKVIKTAQGWRPHSESGSGPASTIGQLTEKIRHKRDQIKNYEQKPILNDHQRNHVRILHREIKELSVERAKLSQTDIKNIRPKKSQATLHNTLKDILEDREGARKVIEAIEHYADSPNGSDRAYVNEKKHELRTKYGYDYDEGRPASKFGEVDRLLREAHQAMSAKGSAKERDRVLLEIAAEAQQYRDSYSDGKSTMVAAARRDELVQHYGRAFKYAMSGVSKSTPAPKTPSKTKTTSSPTPKKKVKVSTSVTKFKKLLKQYGALQHAEELSEPDFASQLDASDMAGIVGGIVEDRQMSKSDGARVLAQMGHPVKDIAKTLGMNYSHAHTIAKKLKVSGQDSAFVSVEEARKYARKHAKEMADIDALWSRTQFPEHKLIGKYVTAQVGDKVVRQQIREVRREGEEGTIRIITKYDPVIVGPLKTKAQSSFFDMVEKNNHVRHPGVKFDDGSELTAKHFLQTGEK